MDTDARLEELLQRYQEAALRGSPPDPRGLCRDCPELLDALQRRLAEAPTAPGALPVPTTAGGTALSPTSVTNGEGQTSRWQAGVQPVAGYTLLRLLGRGGFGEVWEATAPGGFRVAFKFVSLGGQTGILELRALEIIRNLRHPNLLTIFGTWQLDAWLIIGMELADETLHDQLRRSRERGRTGLSRRPLVRYSLDTAKVIDYLNKPRHFLDGPRPVGIRHGDIKPQNILLLGEGVKVGDFGLVELLQSGVAAAGNGMTLPYAAPEVFEKRPSERSDQYSLAIAWCELRGGRLPFVGDALAVREGHLRREPDLSMLPEVERPLVARALAKDPTQRWPSCRAFIKALADAQKDAPRPPSAAPEQQQPAPPPPHPWHDTSLPRPRARGIVYLALGLTLMLLAGLVWSLLFFLSGSPGGGGPSGRPPGGLALGSREDRDKERSQRDFQERDQAPSGDKQKDSLRDRDKEPVRDWAAKKDDSKDACAKDALTLAPGPVQDGKAKERPVPTEGPPEPDETPHSPSAASSWLPWLVVVVVLLAGLGVWMRFRRRTKPTEVLPPDVEPEPPDEGVLYSLRSVSRREIYMSAPLAERSEPRRLAGHADAVWCLALAPDGRLAASGSLDGVVRLWRFPDGEEQRRWAGHGNGVTGLAFSPDGRLLLVGALDSMPRLYEVASGNEVCHFAGQQGRVFGVAFAPDGRRVATGGEGCVRLWDVATGSALAQFSGDEGRVTALAFSPDGRHLLSASQDGSLRRWDLSAGREVGRFEGHAGPVLCLALSPDGSVLASGGEDRTVRLWDVDSGLERRRYDGHGDWVRGVAFTPDGRQLLSGGDDEALYVWSVASEGLVRQVPCPDGSVLCVAVTPDGRFALAGSDDHSVRVWPLEV